MNIADFIIIGIIILIIALAFVIKSKRKKKGCGCCQGCDGKCGRPFK